MRKFDVVIVGSGIASLTAATLLVKRGRSVCVLERHAKPGGYLHCFQRFGARFDTGAHYVGALEPGAPFHRLLRYLDLYDPSLFTPLDPEGFDELHFPSFSARLAQGYERTIDGLSRQFPHCRDGIRRYFGEVAAAAKRFPTYEYCDEYDERALEAALETPLAAVARREIRDPRLLCVLYAYCWLHGVAPDDVGFGFHAIVTDSLLRGAHGFCGGGDALARRYVEEIERLGGTVELKCGARELRAKDGEVREVITDREEAIAADWVISGIHPKATLRLLRDASEHFRPAFVQRIERLRESDGVFGVYALLTDADDFRRDRNYYFFPGEDPDTFFSVGDPASVPTMTYAARPDREGSKAGSAPLAFHAPGPLAWFEPWRGTPYARRGEAYADLKRQRAEAVIAFVDRFRVGLKSRVEKWVASTPLSNLHFNGSEDGSAYGIYHSIAHSGARALGPRTRLTNLLLTGQSTLFPGLLGAATSGLRTAGALVGLKPILRELRALE